MRNGLLLRFALPGAVSQKISASVSLDLKLIRRAQHQHLMQHLFFILMTLFALISFTNPVAQAQSFATTARVKRLAPFQSFDTEEGSKLRITSDSSLDYYKVFE